MSKPEMLVVMPTRGRPENVGKVIRAWNETEAWGVTDLALAVDRDDPRYDDYLEFDRSERGLQVLEFATWRPMVYKLNALASQLSEFYFAIGFQGDDHLPRTVGWAGMFLDALREMGTGIVYGNDLYQGQRIPTQWVMTTDIIRALDGRMVPANVEHLYCDNAVLALGQAANCIRYLPEVVVEHVNPYAGKGGWDAQYRRVNSREQYRKDSAAFTAWERAGLPDDAERVRLLCRTGTRP